MMKKFFVCLLLIGSFGSQLHSANPENIIQQFSSSKDVDNISIGRVGMFLLKMFVTDADFRSVAKSITSLKISMLNENCTEEKKNEYRKQLKTLQDNEIYATLLTVKDGSDDVHIMIKKEKDVIRELIIITSGEDDVAIVRLKGKLKESDLGTATAQFNKK